METALDLIGDMRDDLYRTSAKVSAAFFLQNGPVNLTGSYIGIFSQAFINETLIVSKVKVSFSAVVCDEDFAVLYRVHGTWVDVDVGVKFLHGNFVASGL